MGLLVVLLNPLHPVLSAGAAWLSILLGGIAGLGRGLHLKLGLAAIVVALCSVLLLASYTPPDGFQLPTRSTVMQAVIFYAVPLFAALVLIIIGRFTEPPEAP